MHPPYPPLEAAGLRLATGAYISRLAELSVLGFKDSEIFRFERPRYDEFPEDAVASFCNIYRSQLLDPRSVVVVAEDEAEAETESTTSARVVVGVASWCFPDGSLRTGQFVAPDVGEPVATPDRDLCQRRLELSTKITRDTEKKYFSGAAICDKLVVRPSYRRRGHATSMLRWNY